MVLGPLCKYSLNLKWQFVIVFQNLQCNIALGTNTYFSWTVGNVWPTDGEVDMLEGWNTNSFNKPAFHMNKVSQFGSCTISNVGQSATVATSNCDNDYSNPPIQWNNQGCVGNDVKGPWASADGGVCKSILQKVRFYSN